MREYMRSQAHEIDDDLDISIEIHSPSKGEPGYRPKISEREFDEGCEAWKRGCRDNPYDPWLYPKKSNRWISGWVHMEECAKIAEKFE